MQPFLECLTLLFSSVSKRCKSWVGGEGFQKEGYSKSCFSVALLVLTGRGHWRRRRDRTCLLLTCCSLRNSWTHHILVLAAFGPSFQLLLICEGFASLARPNSHGSESPFTELPLSSMYSWLPLVSPALRVEIAISIYQFQPLASFSAISSLTPAC